MGVDVVFRTVREFAEAGATCPDCGGKVATATSQAIPFLGGLLKYNAQCPRCQGTFTVSINEPVQGGAIESNLRNFLDAGVQCQACGATIEPADAERSPDGAKQYYAKCPRCHVPNVIVCS